MLFISPYIVYFLPTILSSSLSSVDEVTRCDLYAGRSVKSLPVGCIQPVPAVLLLIKFSSKARVSLNQSQTRTNRRRRSDSSSLPASCVCLKHLSSLFDPLSILNSPSFLISKIQLVNTTTTCCSAETADSL